MSFSQLNKNKIICHPQLPTTTNSVITEIAQTEEIQDRNKFKERKEMAIM